MRDALFTNSAEALEYLNDIARCDDSDIDVFEASLALALQEHPGKSIDQYRQHLEKMVMQTQRKYDSLMADNGLPDAADTRILALRHVMTRVNGYAGDAVHYDDIQNADIIRTIDRRLGMPITIAIMAMALAQRLGWALYGLNFPGHFLVRFDAEKGRRIILDPFHLFAEVDAAQMRKLLKENLGIEAELSSEFYEAAEHRDILIRLQNNIKFRLIEAEDYVKALACVQIMKCFAPQEHRLYFDEGILLSRLNQPSAAVTALRQYLEHAPNAKDKIQVLSIINELTAMMH